MKEETKALILLRGLPGSGKSTLAVLLSENGKYPFYSIDDYFTNSQNGKYEFNFSENHLAYKQCESNTEKSLIEGVKKVIIHNTFTINGKWSLILFWQKNMTISYLF